MKIILPDNHPSLTQSYEVDQLLKSHFPDSPLSYFQFYKLHKDGSASLVTNNADWVKTAYTLNVRKSHSCAKPEYLDKKNYWFLWDYHLQDAPLDILRNQFNIANGLCFLERHVDSFYLISFATHNKFEGALDFYLNRFDALRNFIRYFRETKTGIIDKIDKNRIILPKEDQDPNNDALMLKGSEKLKIPVYFESSKSYVTLQEYECIRRLPQGKSAKEIAKELNISHRTVETYFSRVMNRTGLNKKKDLISLISSL